MNIHIISYLDVLDAGYVTGFSSARYNGLPPDNASKFKKWLVQKAQALEGLKFAVFGVGNSQWHTYQQFPREVDAALSSAGGQRLSDLGACDVDGASFVSDFEDWRHAVRSRVLYILRFDDDI